MKIALFGGSFDPPHIGHEAIVSSASTLYDLIYIVPTFLSPFKSSFAAPPELRLKWVKKLWDEYKNIKISDYEISQNAPTPSIKTARYIKSLHKDCELFIIIGADQLNDLDRWHEINELKKIAKFVIATRPDQVATELEYLQTLPICANISSSQIRSKLDFSAVPSPLRSEIKNFYTQRSIMQNRVDKIRLILDDKKAENIETVDMQDRSYIAKFVIIATTLASRHAASLLDELKTQLKPAGEEFLAVEATDDWTVIDLGDIIVHLMSEQYRAKYNIEEFLATLKPAEF